MLIEMKVKEYLDSVFEDTGVEVRMEMPEDISGSFIVISIVNRSSKDHVNNVTLEFSSYAPTKLEAARLDETVREAMDDISSLPDISGHFGGGNDDIDSVIKKYRYRCYYNLYY